MLFSVMNAHFKQVSRLCKLFFFLYIRMNRHWCLPGMREATAYIFVLAVQDLMTLMGQNISEWFQLYRAHQYVPVPIQCVSINCCVGCPLTHSGATLSVFSLYGLLYQRNKLNHPLFITGDNLFIHSNKCLIVRIWEHLICSSGGAASWIKDKD